MMKKITVIIISVCCYLFGVLVGAGFAPPPIGPGMLAISVCLVAALVAGIVHIWYRLSDKYKPITLNKPLKVYLIVLDDGWSTFGVYADYADALAVARPVQAQIRVQYVHPKGWTPQQTWAAIPDNAEEDLKIQFSAGWGE